MKNGQTLSQVKRRFYATMGPICIFVSIVVLFKIITDFVAVGSGLLYGQAGIPMATLIPPVVVQGIHVVLAMIFWIALFLLGLLWTLRAMKNLELFAKE